MKYLHYLRIAFSISCGIACIVLVVLWVRSYYVRSSLATNTAYRLDVGGGKLIVSSHGTSPNGGREHRAGARSAGNGIDEFLFSRSMLGFYYYSAPGHKGLAIPCGALVFTSALFAAAPWLTWRFSLRTLLIAITLVAVVLGLIVWPKQ